MKNVIKIAIIIAISSASADPYQDSLTRQFREQQALLRFQAEQERQQEFAQQAQQMQREAIRQNAAAYQQNQRLQNQNRNNYHW